MALPSIEVGAEFSSFAQLQETVSLLEKSTSTSWRIMVESDETERQRVYVAVTPHRGYTTSFYTHKGARRERILWEERDE